MQRAYSVNDDNQSSNRILSLRGAFGFLTAYCILFALAGFLIREISPMGRILLVMAIVTIPPATICVLRWDWKAIVVFALILFFGAVFFLLPIVQAARETGSPPQTCDYHLKYVALALHGYHEVHGTFPPAYIADQDGKPIHSWRTLILPYMEYNGSFYPYDSSQPWDAPENLELLKQHAPREYGCAYCRDKQPPSDTMVVAITGEGTAWPGPNSTCLNDITDGIHSTIFLMSIDNSGIAWTEPRDLELDSFRITDVATSSGDVSSQHGAGVFVARMDGSVAFLNATIDMSEMQGLCTINAADVATDEHFSQATKGVRSRSSRYDDVVIPGVIMALAVMFGVILFSSQISHKHGTKISGKGPSP